LAVQVLKDQAAGAAHTRLECRCSPYHANSAMYPIIDLLQRVLQFARDETPTVQVDKLATALTQYRLPRGVSR
jgi:hypothetical protein